MKKVIILLVAMLATNFAFSQVKNFQMEPGSTADQFLVTGASPFVREFKSVNDVKAILGIPTSGVTYTDDQTIDVFSLSGTTLSLSLENDGQAAQTVNFTGWDTDVSDDFSGDWSDITGIPSDIADGDDDTQLSQEQVQDFVGPLVSGNTETLISVTYDDGGNALDFVVEDDLSLYDNTTSGFLTSEVDGSTSNELQTLSYGSNPPGVQATISLSDGGGNIEFSAGSNITISDNGGSGPIQISSTGTGESTTVTDGNTVDFTLSGTDITGEVILDPSGNNIATSSGSGLLVTNDLSQYDNSTSGFLTSEVDGSTTNELQDLSSSAGTNIDDGSLSLSSSSNQVNFETEQFGSGPFTLANTPIFIISVHRNGVYQELTDDYTVSGSTISLVGTAFGGSEELTVVYVHN